MAVVAATTKIETRKLSEWQGWTASGTMEKPARWFDCSYEVNLTSPLIESAGTLDLSQERCDV